MDECTFASAKFDAQYYVNYADSRARSFNLTKEYRERERKREHCILNARADSDASALESVINGFGVFDRIIL